MTAAVQPITPELRRWIVEQAEIGRPSEDILQAMRDSGWHEDVARAALFFLSPDNGFVTGQVLYVCGGTTLGVAPV